MDGLNDDVRFTSTNWCVQMFWFLLLVGVRARLKALFTVLAFFPPV